MEETLTLTPHRIVQGQPLCNSSPNKCFMSDMGEWEAVGGVIQKVGTMWNPKGPLLPPFYALSITETPLQPGIVPNKAVFAGALSPAVAVRRQKLSWLLTGPLWWGKSTYLTCLVGKSFLQWEHFWLQPGQSIPSIQLCSETPRWNLGRFLGFWPVMVLGEYACGQLWTFSISYNDVVPGTWGCCPSGVPQPPSWSTTWTSQQWPRPWQAKVSESSVQMLGHRRPWPYRGSWSLRPSPSH